MSPMRRQKQIPQRKYFRTNVCGKIKIIPLVLVEQLLHLCISPIEIPQMGSLLRVICDFSLIGLNVRAQPQPTHPQKKKLNLGNNFTAS